MSLAAQLASGFARVGTELKALRVRVDKASPLVEYPPQSKLYVSSSDGLFPNGSVTFGAHMSNTAPEKHGEAVAAFGELVGRAPVIDHQFYGTDSVFPTPDHPSQPYQIPMITWQSTTNTLDQLLAGASDAFLTERAIDCKERGGPILFRPLHEMNGNWYFWSGAKNGANIAATAKYVAVWKRIYNIFKAAGADNVKFVWCPVPESVPGPGSDPWNAAANYYPGDAFVDYIGVDGYNSGPTTVTSPTSLFNTFMTTWAPRGKKMIVCEVSSADNGTAANGSVDSGQDKAKWINDLAAAISSAWPSVAALVWFNTNKEHDWRVNSSTTSLTAFKAMINKVNWESLRKRAYARPKISRVRTGFAGYPPEFGFVTGATVAGGAAQIAVGNGNNGVYNTMSTIDAYDLTSTSFFFKLTPASGGTQPITQLQIAGGQVGGTDITLSVEGGFMYAGTRANYSFTSPISWVFSPGSYVRINESGGTMTIFDSPDAISWTERAFFPLGSQTVSAAFLSFLAWNTGGTSTPALIDNFNTTRT